ncbi:MULTISPECIES: flagellar basal body-associated FliL family protein [unclassified Gilliamella]|uniref:flagellar basal body-associated FliL family protein n=1 Tax=unclassified Gilliamella TaxID=2685620 RepID=UPI002269CCE0|nr:MULTISPECIES: flagellar basal body-associated FliL family protein [unclassified Gilliamella]MCX8575104.1 flagellar basal body-associated FliL family protein [Gilliamella sp. B3831]MCX8577486.1 flagellar basal body-associated FliL family protein [Gilliamella sp. B3815]MCX8590770.1 flagellar basal body-associated FliL family protein [Gilliamella sp. B3812]MCX8604436.1 flagellar basal body-associated FliL family protein [Gilliamella sp. B3823]MCX8605359.1 flagellar basal body-associated FliL f
MPTSKKKVSILNLILIIITMLALATTAYLWFQNQSKNTIKTKEEPPVLSPVFLTLKPFTISLPTSEDSTEINKVLYVGMVLRVADEEQKSVLLEYLPEVRSDVLLLTSKQYVNNLKLETGKLDLQEQIKVALSRQYDPKHSVKVDEVLFTDFIIR